MPELEEFRDQVKAIIEQIGRDFTQPDDDWMQVMCLDTDEGVVVVGLPNEFFANGVSKDKLAIVLKQAMKMVKANNYAVLFNAHMKGFNTKEEMDEFHRVRDEQVRIEHLPGARELLLLVYGNAQMEHALSAEITRDGKNPPALGEWTLVGTMSGRFAGLNEELRDTPKSI